MKHTYLLSILLAVGAAQASDVPIDKEIYKKAMAPMKVVLNDSSRSLTGLAFPLALVLTTNPMPKTVTVNGVSYHFNSDNFPLNNNKENK